MQGIAVFVLPLGPEAEEPLHSQHGTSSKTQQDTRKLGRCLIHSVLHGCPFYSALCPGDLSPNHTKCRPGTSA